MRQSECLRLPGSRLELPRERAAHELSYTGWPLQLDERLGGDASTVIIVTPQAARQGEPDPEYLDWGAGRD